MLVALAHIEQCSRLHGDWNMPFGYSALQPSPMRQGITEQLDVIRQVIAPALSMLLRHLCVLLMPTLYSLSHILLQEREAECWSAGQ